MRSEQLRHRITIQQPTISQGSMGGATETWSTLATVWAQKANKSSREFYAAHKINAEITDLFICRHRTGVESNMRVLFDGQAYDIISAIDPDGRRRELHITCKEVV
jgi:SPP1 family predicted phage head-tail adaptor